MSVKESIQEKIEKMSQADLEWLEKVLAQGETDTQRRLKLLEEFAAPIPAEDVEAFKSAVARRPWRSEQAS